MPGAPLALPVGGAGQRGRGGGVSGGHPIPFVMPARTASRPLPAIPTASVADVAFLLLLFFLVTTAIRTETGLPITLPPPTTASGLAGVPSLLVVLVGADGGVLAGGERVRGDGLRAAVARFAETSARPHVALQASRQTPYDDYVGALDAVLMGHRDAGVEPRLTLREPVR